MIRIYEHAAAKEDITVLFLYLLEHAGSKTASKFLSRVDESYQLIGGQPTIGSPLTVSHPSLVGLRKWRVKEFESYLIFYVQTRHAISILRVIHAARDWWSLIEGEE